MGLTDIFSPVHLPLATGVELGILVVGIALSAIAGLLLKPKAPRNSFARKNNAPTLAERGSFIPFLIGTRRIGAVVAWMGGAKVTSSESGGFLGFGSTTTKKTSQSAWHILCVGPGESLLSIYEGGKLIFPTGSEVPLTRSGDPSGTSVTLNSGAGTFRIYWGENNQPLDSLLTHATEGLNIASRWPNVMFIVWDKKKLATANQWPQIDYVVEVHPVDVTGPLLADSAAWMNGTSESNGANPAHALMQIMCESYPHGIGLVAADDINSTLMEAFGVLLETENQPVNIILENGDEALAPIASILQETGAFLPQVGSKLLVLPIRAVDPGDSPELPSESLGSPLAEKEFLFGEKGADRLIFLYPERSLNFRDNDITIDDDTEGLGRPKVRNIELETVIDGTIAQKVVDRRQQEELVSVRGFKIHVSRGARVLSPGQTFQTDDLGQLRVLSKEAQTDSPDTVLECVQDAYSLAATGVGTYIPNPIDPTTGIARDEYDYIELPPSYRVGTEGPKIGIMRHRGSISVIGATISVNLPFEPGEFRKVDDINEEAFVGTLDDALSIDGPVMIDEGPTFVADSDIDNDLFIDLAANVDRWRDGEQIAIINGEICFFKTLVSLGSSNYRIDGLIRGRKGTLMKNHAASSRVWLMIGVDLDNLGSTIRRYIKKGTTLDVLVRAYDLGITTEISIATALPAASHLITGLTLTPYPPVNFRADDLTGNYFNTFPAGGDVVFRWSNRSRIQDGSTAGNQPAGTAVLTQAPMDGNLVLLIKNISNVLKETITLTSGRNHTYTQAALVAAFGVEPSSFIVEFYQNQGIYSSIVGSITVDRR